MTESVDVVGDAPVVDVTSTQKQQHHLPGPALHMPLVRFAPPTS